MLHSLSDQRRRIRRVLLGCIPLLLLAITFSPPMFGAGGARGAAINAGGLDAGVAGSAARQATAGVTISADSATFRFGELITGAVVNGLPQSIFTQDEQTDCSIAVLEQWDGAAWQPRRGCALRRLARTVEIVPGAREVFTIDPSSIHLATRQDAPPVALDPGLYRLTLTYWLTPEVPTRMGATVASGCFQILP